MNNRRLKKKSIILMIAMAAVIAVGIFLIIAAQRYGVRADYETESVNFTNRVVESMGNRERDLKALDEYNKSVSSDLIYNITFIYDGTDFPNLNWKMRDKLNPRNVCDMDAFNLEALYICGDDGTIWLCDDESLLDKNIVEEGILTEADMAFFNEDGYGTYKTRYDENGNPYVSVEPVSGYADGHKVKYYAVKVIGKNQDEMYYAIGADNSDLETQINAAYSELGAFFDPIVDYDGFSAFAVNTDTGIIEYVSPKNAELKGRLATDVGLEGIENMDDGQFHDVEIAGDSHRVFVKNNRSTVMGNYAIAAADIDVDGPLAVAALACIIILIITVVILFSTGYKLATERRKHLVKEYTACVVACIVLVGVVCFYISTISSISQAMTQCKANAEAFSKYYISGRENAERMSEFYKTKKVSVLKSIAIYLEQNQDKLMDETDQKVYEYYDTDEQGKKEYILDSNGNVTRSISENMDLRDIADDEAYKDLYIVNSQGNTVLTSSDNWYFTINDGKSGYDEQFNSVLERKAKDFYKYTKNEDSGAEVVAVPYEMYISNDGEGHTRYHSTDEYLKDTTGTIKPEQGLLVAISNTTTDLRLSMESIPREMLNSMRAAEGAELAVTDKTEEGYEIVLSSDGIRDEDFAEMNIPESYYLSDNYKFANVNSINCMLGVSCLAGVKEMNIITAMKDADIQSQRWPIVIATLIAILIAGIVLIAYFTKLYKLGRTEERQKASDVDSIAAEYEDEELEGNWSRTSGILGMVLLIALLVVYTLLRGEGLLQFIEYVITVKWEKGVHIFSISYFMYMIIVVIVVIAIAREFVHLLAPVLNARAETMLRLLLSLLQYGCIIASFFYTLYLFGLQMGTVVTSASIMTLVLGLGANSLIGDILAGLFIIFEHEYQVGNWITIGDYTGVVRAIGLRTTKVENKIGNIKTFNNSKINEVLNLSENYTAAFFQISISNDIPLKRVDALVIGKLKERTAYCKEIISGPMPGILSKKPDYTEGYYYYKVLARCEEQNVTKVTNLIFGEFIEILKEEKIPFL